VIALSLLALAGAVGALASISAHTGGTLTAFLLCVAAAGLLVFGVRAVVGHWTTLSLLFCAFFALYGLSGPLNAVLDRPLAAIFAYPYRTDDFLAQQAHATIGLAMGFAVGGLLRDGFVRASRHIRVAGWLAALAARRPRRPTLDLPFSTALLCLALGSVFELITFVRVGGLPVVALGKASYQSRSVELTMTLPSMEMVSIGIGLAALWFGHRIGRLCTRERLLRAGLLLLAGLPVFALTLVLGRRGPLFGWAFVWLIGHSMHRPLRTIPFRLVAAGSLLVIASGLLFASRATLGYAAGTGDWGPFIGAVTDVPRVIAAVNPADSEFGAPFGNFSEYAARSNEQPRRGGSYLAGLVTLVPGSLYPGEKPRTVTYEFRDSYFASEAGRGAIAGTGFSSILEAYMNFGSAGVTILYALVGALLLLLERLRRLGPYAGLFYLLLIPVTQSFHRSEFSLALGSAFMSLLLLLFVRGCALTYTLLTTAVHSPRRGVQHA
jgi:hypothetical protein